MANGANPVPDIPATAEWQLPPDEWARVDRACDRFEKAWQAGQPPVLTAIVEDVDSPAGQILLCELLKIELAYRARRGEQPTQEEYQAIFPKHANLIAAVFGPAATKPMPEPDPDQHSTSAGGTDSPPAVSTRSPGDTGARCA